MSLLLLFQYSEETLKYFNLSVLQPDRKNEVLGLMQPKGTVYCRVCIDKLNVPFTNMKYLTYQHTLPQKKYICVNCGNRIRKNNIYNRYYKVNKIGKRRYN